MIQDILADPAWAARLDDEDKRGLNPLFTSNMTPYGEVKVNMASRLEEDRCGVDRAEEQVLGETVERSPLLLDRARRKALILELIEVRRECVGRERAQRCVWRAGCRPPARQRTGGKCRRKSAGSARSCAAS
jgi:hypothetical protein